MSPARTVFQMLCSLAVYWHCWHCNSFAACHFRATAWTVTVPNYPCDCCYLRLTREAMEWTGPMSWGGRYLFWSCAPVQIVAEGGFRVKRETMFNYDLVSLASSSCDETNCSGHGKCNGGTCTCSGMWYGKYCQYKDGCRVRSDCNGHGNCVDLKSTSPPAHQCFCNAGWHGPLCNKGNYFN